MSGDMAAAVDVLPPGGLTIPEVVLKKLFVKQVSWGRTKG